MGFDLFFDADRVAEAKAVCAACEVRSECLAWALRHETPGDPKAGGGVWGGMTMPERRREKMRVERVARRLREMAA